MGEGLVGFFYANFSPIGSAVLKLFPGISAKLESAGIRIYPPAYASTIGGITLISLIICAPLSAVLYLFTETPLAFLLMLAPLVILLLGVMYPYAQASSIASVFQSEVPYAATYLAVMATGGVPPYTSLKRIAKSELMPNLARIARIADIRVEAAGEDPISAIEFMAKNVPSKEYRDLLLGYVSTLRSGGDVVHFLIRKTETIFEGRTASMKIVGERLGMLMEAYAAAVMMLSLVLYIIYIVSRALPSEYFSFPASQFIVFSYLIMPLFASSFIYLSDITQPKYPFTDKRPFKAFLYGLPAGLTFFALFVIPFYAESLRYVPPFNFTSDLIVKLRELMGLGLGYEASIALCLAFIIIFIPGAVAWDKYGKENMAILHGLTLFLRDLTEARKTGMSPEKCMIILSDRDYGGFTKQLKLMSRQIGWGVPLRKIYEDFEKRVYGWLARAGMFILIDSIDVGGGAPETLDTLATFMENLEEMEREKRATLKPLILIPYLSSIMLVIVIVILIVFMKGLLKLARIYLSIPEFVHTFLPPVILIAVVSGLVAGKISEGTVAAGFKHAVIMSAITLLAIWISGTMSIQMVTFPTASP